jgi:hypothetical protein
MATTFLCQKNMETWEMVYVWCCMLPLDGDTRAAAFMPFARRYHCVGALVPKRKFRKMPPPYMTTLQSTHNTLGPWGWELLQHPLCSPDSLLHIHSVRYNEAIKPRFITRVVCLPPELIPSSDGKIYKNVPHAFKRLYSVSRVATSWPNKIAKTYRVIFIYYYSSKICAYVHDPIQCKPN